MKSIEAKDDDDGRLQPEGAGRDLAAAPDHGLLRDRPLRRLPGRQAAAERRGGRLRPLHARRVPARPADGDGEERRLPRATPRPKNDRVIIQYFDKASPLKLAVENGDVDIAYRSLSPTDIDDLEGADGVNVVSGNGTEIRYLVFNLELQPGDNDEQKLAIRQAAAQVDRSPGDRRQRLQRHRPAALLDGPAGRRVRDERVRRRVRRGPGRRGRQADARGRRRRHAGAARGLVDAVALRRRPPATSTPRSSASSTTAASST